MDQTRPLLIEQYRHWAQKGYKRGERNPLPGDPHGVSLPMRADRLVSLALGYHRGSPPVFNAFRPASPRTVGAELRAVRGQAETLLASLARLHASAIAALADHHALVRTPEYTALLDDVEQLATKVSRLALDDLPIQRAAEAASGGAAGAPRNLPLRAVAMQLANDFWQLRCEHPFDRKPSHRNGFVPVVEGMFRILRLPSPAALVREIESKKEWQPPRPPDTEYVYDDQVGRVLEFDVATGKMHPLR